MALVQFAQLNSKEVCDSLDDHGEEQKKCLDPKTTKPEGGTSGDDVGNKHSVHVPDKLESDVSSLSSVRNTFKRDGELVSAYIKLKSESALSLLTSNQKAYLLLNLIALRASRSPDHQLGLNIGESLVGDYEKIGLTRQEYRTALKYLKDNNFIEIVETCRTSKSVAIARQICQSAQPSNSNFSTINSTINLTIKGTKVKLADDSVWDLNLESKKTHLTINPTIEPTIDEKKINHEQDIYKLINTKTRVTRDRECEGKSAAPYVASPLATSLLADFYSSLLKSIPDFPKAKMKNTKSQLQSAERLLNRYGEMVVRQVIAYAHTPGGFWTVHVHSVSYLEKKFETIREQIKNPGFNKSKPQLAGMRHNYNEGVNNPRNPSKVWNYDD